MLEAFDLTGSLRAAAELSGCDHKTVAHWVAARDAAGGGLPAPTRPRPMVDRVCGRTSTFLPIAAPAITHTSRTAVMRPMAFLCHPASRSLRVIPVGPGRSAS
jgi:hypothetical protein